MNEKGVKQGGGKQNRTPIKQEAMCLYPRIIRNKKYIPNMKNKGIPPIANDMRTQSVAVGCQNCIECRKKKAREWQIRLQEEIKTNKGMFVTLTFSEEKLKELEKAANSIDANTVAKFAVRRFLERWRKKYKKSVRHWLITELGHNNTERIHLHGILFTDQPHETIDYTWNYGNIWIGAYCNSRTVNYIVKYVTKIDNDHKGYKSLILTSAGIGKNYTNTWNAKQNKFKDETNETYRLNNGAKTSLPIYYRNKIYTEEEREKLWIQKLDKKERYIMGHKYEFKTQEQIHKYLKDLKYYQSENIIKGYGTDSKEWNEQKYMTTINKLNK